MLQAESYLTKAQAVARLVDAEHGFGIDAETANQIRGGDLRLASDELDDMGPFIGLKASSVQYREWPRRMYGHIDFGDESGVILTPENILDWVALRALQLATEDEAAVISEKVLDASVTYSHPVTTQTERRMRRLLDPYLLVSGTRH